MGTWGAARCVIWALIFGSVGPIKTDATFFLHKTLKPVFGDLHREISPLSVPKKHRRLDAKS